MIKREDLVKIGQFTKPHGVKGEISLLTDYDIFGITGEPYIVCDMDDIPVPFFIDSLRQKSGKITLVKFENIDSEDKVKVLIGKSAYIPSDMLPALDEGAVGWNYITGFVLIDDALGEIGYVKSVDDSTANVLLMVDYKNSEILIPAALVESVSREEKTMTVSLPEGFLDI